MVNLHTDHIHHVIKGLFIGDIYAARNLKLLTSLKISHIVNLSGEKPFFEDQFFYMNIKIADSPRSNIARYFPVTNWLIDCAIKGGCNVFVHCAAGKSRSASIVIAYLLFKNKSMTPNAAFEFLRSKRPIVLPNEGFENQINMWWISLNPQRRIPPKSPPRSPRKAHSATDKRRISVNRQR